MVDEKHEIESVEPHAAALALAKTEPEAAMSAIEEEDEDGDVPTDEVEDDEEGDDAEPEVRSSPPSLAKPVFRHKARLRALKRRRLVPHPRGVNAWRCKRLEADGTRTSLYWAEDGTMETTEWDIATCSPVVISGRWGPGEYVCEFYEITAEGRRVARGRSPVIHLRKHPSDREAPVAAEPPKAAVEYRAAAPLVGGNDVLALIGVLEQRNDRMYQQMFAQMRTQSDREIALIRATSEKEKQDNEMRSLRERLASKERIEQMRLQVQQHQATPEGVASQLEDVTTALSELAETQRQLQTTQAELQEAQKQGGGGQVVELVKQIGPQLPMLFELLRSFGPQPPPAVPQVHGAGNAGGVA